MRLIDADALAEEIQEKMNNGFPANENLSLYAISCLAHAPTVDVLDKIIAEIEQERKNCEEVHDHYAGRVLENVLSIIGKYKGGSK